jgi:diacylglycerol kinase family enzyme
VKLLALINSAAGSVSGAQDSAARVKAAFKKHGVETTIKLVRGAEIAAAARDFTMARANGNGHGNEALVVAGGDGTISAAASELAGKDLPLGILPLGTLNHFAKDLGLPLDIEGAAGVIAAGRSQLVDVAELNGRVFVNNSSIGLYPFMVDRRNAHQRQRGISKLFATLPAMVETLRRASWHRLEITAAGKRQRVRTPCIFVGNNPYETGLAAFGCRTRLDCGELDVHVIRQQSRLGVLLLPFKIALGIVNRERDVQTFCSAELKIDSRRRRSLRVSLDGEIVHMQTPLRYRSRPGALRVICGPAPVPAA